MKPGEGGVADPKKGGNIMMQMLGFYIKTGTFFYIYTKYGWTGRVLHGRS
jgi:hypothetical protein